MGAEGWSRAWEELPFVLGGVGGVGDVGERRDDEPFRESEDFGVGLRV